MTDTPTLYGKDAERFLQEVEDNARRDRRAEYNRLAASRFEWEEEKREVEGGMRLAAFVFLFAVFLFFMAVRTIILNT